jgi:LPXTG-motif cell wall-anchored protein
MLLMLVYFVLVTAPALADDEAPKKAPPSNAAPYKEPNKFVEFLKDLFTDWLFIVGVVALLALVGVLIYVKKKQSEDD